MSSPTPTSLPSIVSGSQSSDALSKLEQTAQPTAVDLTAAALERQLQREIDSRSTERFFWIFATSVLVYGIIVRMMDNGPAAVGLFLLLIVFLIGAAAWCGVDNVRILLERIASKYLGSNK